MVRFIKASETRKSLFEQGEPGNPASPAQTKRLFSGGHQVKETAGQDASPRRQARLAAQHGLNLPGRRKLFHLGHAYLLALNASFLLKHLSPGVNTLKQRVEGIRELLPPLLLQLPSDLVVVLSPSLQMQSTETDGSRRV